MYIDINYIDYRKKRNEEILMAGGEWYFEQR